MRSEPLAGPAVLLVGEEHAAKVYAPPSCERARWPTSVRRRPCRGRSVGRRGRARPASGGPRPTVTSPILIPSRTVLDALEDALDAAERAVPHREQLARLRQPRGARPAAGPPGHRRPERRAGPRQHAALPAVRLQRPRAASDGSTAGVGGGASCPASSRRPRPGDDPVRDGIAYLQALAASRHWATPAELLDRLVRDRRVLEVAGHGRRARDVWRRLRYLVDQARVWREAGGGTLRDYLAWAYRQATDSVRVTEAVLPETDHDAVRIMTVHAAKGLEFPIVMVAGLTTQPQGGRRRRRRDLDRRHGPQFRLASNIVTTRTTRRPAPSTTSSTTTSGGGSSTSPARGRATTSSCRSTARRAATGAAHAGRTGRRLRPGTRAGRRRGARGARAAREHDRPVTQPRADPVTARRRRRRRATAPPGDAATGRRPVDLERWRAEPRRAPRWRGGRARTDRGHLPRRPRQPRSPCRRRPRAWPRVRSTSTRRRGTRAATAPPSGGPCTPSCRPSTSPPATAWRRPRRRRPPPRACSAGRARSRRWPGRPSAAAWSTRRLAVEHWREVFVATPVGDTLLEGYVDLLFRDDDGLVVVDYKTDQPRDDADLDGAGGPLPPAAGRLRPRAWSGSPARRFGRAVLVFCSPSAGASARELEVPDLPGGDGRRGPIGSAQRQPERPHPCSSEQHQHGEDAERDQRRQQERPARSPTTCPRGRRTRRCRPPSRRGSSCTPDRARCRDRRAPRSRGRRTFDGEPFVVGSTAPRRRRTGGRPSRSGCRPGSRPRPGWPGSSPERTWATA